MKDLLSVCILSYKRPQFLEECLQSLRLTVDYPIEVIVGDDTSGNAEFLLDYLKNDRISKLILNAGGNRGVGRNLQNCIGVSEGEYILKCDGDIVFSSKWASECVAILTANPDISTISLFDYRKNYDNNDTRFNIIEEHQDCLVVDDFVSSCYMFRRSELPVLDELPDDGLHSMFPGKKAITKYDRVINKGFGIPNSVYVTLNEKGEAVKTPTTNHPLIVV